jgi:hypothetical protein
MRKTNHKNMKLDTALRGISFFLSFGLRYRFDWVSGFGWVWGGMGLIWFRGLVGSEMRIKQKQN